MKFDFDKITPRRGTSCVKWDDEGSLPDVIPMWVADMDFPAAPCIQQALQQRLDHGVFAYTIVPESYYEATTQWYERRHSWYICREWMQYTTGVVPALSAIIKALTKPSDKVIIQTPAYNCFFSSVRNQGCTVAENRLRKGDDNRFHIDYDNLEKLAADPETKLMLLCNPHNPVGRVWQKDELARIYNICVSHGVVVVSDEIHNELTLPHISYQPFATCLDSDDGHHSKALDNAIVCLSPSKSFNTAGLQMATIVSNNPQWQQKIDRAINDFEICDVNCFAPVGHEAAYRYGDEWIDELRSYIEGNYRYLCQFIAERLPMLRLTPLEGTYLTWIDHTATGLSTMRFTALLLNEARVRVSPGTLYGNPDTTGPDNAGEGYIRMNIACPRKQLEEALERIAAAMMRS